MIQKLWHRPVAALVCVFLFAVAASAQITQQEKEQAERVKAECTDPLNIGTWLNCKVDEISASRLQQRDPGKLVQVPSIADNTTALVDKSEAPDILGVALNLAGLSAGDEEDEKKSSVSFTTTAYALYAGLTQRDPLNPSLYSRHQNLRRFSFTFGQETPEGEEGGERATILGTKIMIFNKRDVSDPRNRALLRPLTEKLKVATRDFNRITDDVQTYLYEQLWRRLNLKDPSLLTTDVERNIEKDKFINNHLQSGQTAATISMLSDAQLADVTDIITERIESRVELDAANLRVIEEIRRAPQLAFTFQSKLRERDGTDEYRTGLTFDYGLYRRINLTLNGSFDYNDSKAVGGDTRGARFAGETHFQLTPDRRITEGAGPWVFAVAGEAKWMSNVDATYTGQLKLTIPLLDGLDLPLSVSFANRSDLVKESHVRGRFGFSFDLPKLLKGVR